MALCLKIAEPFTDLCWAIAESAARVCDYVFYFYFFVISRGHPELNQTDQLICPLQCRSVFLLL